MLSYKDLFRLGALFLFLFTQIKPAAAQDTLYIKLPEFLERGINNSGQIAYESGKINLAENTIKQAKSKRIFPNLALNTQHGVVPGIESDREDLGEGEYYLDPNLENDWNNWAVFTRVELSATQPIYTWGAIDNAVRAAEAGAKSAQYESGAVENEVRIRLFDLYYSYLLAMEISRILEDANSQLEDVEEYLEEMREEGNSDFEESDVFKLEIFKAEFVTRGVEVQQSLDFIKRMWNYALKAGPGIVYVPYSNFLDPVPYKLEAYEFYRNNAMAERPELNSVKYGITALGRKLEAEKARLFPAFFLGITGSFANTPNRPRQTNPFIRNNTNYGSVGIGIGIRQNLNIFSMRADVERAEIEYKRVGDLEQALSDQIIIDLNECYRAATVAEIKMQQTEEALATARKWKRYEQLNLDWGLGDAENLLEAVQKELELRVELKQNIFELNKKVAALYRSSGLSISQLNIN